MANSSKPTELTLLAAFPSLYNELELLCSLSAPKDGKKAKVAVADQRPKIADVLVKTFGWP